jgi:hypothetical protein
VGIKQWHFVAETRGRLFGRGLRDQKEGGGLTVNTSIGHWNEIYLMDSH